MLQLRSKAVIHELLDHEVILADLDSGIYYSILGCGIPIWQLIMAGYDPSGIQALFVEKYGSSQGVQEFIDQLVGEKILVPSADVNPGPFPKDLLWPEPFAAPFLDKYEEMKNLLMLDPIHEVDEQGWPVKDVL